MDKALDIYGYILKEHLSKCFANQQNIDPIELNRERFKVKAVFTASIIFLKNNSNREHCKIVSSTNHWLKNLFADENLLSSIIDNADERLTKLIDENLCNLIGVESIDVSTLYETLLGIETGNENKGTEISTAKNYRNKLGSYYTPANFAKSVTEKTIDTFFESNFGNVDKEFLNEITSISFADFSCGGGNFIIAVIDYFQNLFERWKIEEESKLELLKAIALNISAFDVDYLALEVAKLNLLLKIKNPSLYKSLNEKFIHANFLLQSDFTRDESKKVEVFSSGFIYHEQLSLSKNKLKNYDVILGNPPWEKIRFEEKKFYALYSNTVAKNHFKSSRTNEIAETELNNIQLAEYSKKFKLEIEKAKSDLKKNPFFTLSNNGELNTYALFTNAAVKLKTKRGVVGLVLKSAIVSSQVNQNLFKYLTKENYVVAIYDFINRKKIFNIDSRERFCFLLLGNSNSKRFHVSMNLREVSEIEKAKPEIELSYERLKVLNPFTGMLPNFSNKREADFLLRVSYDFPFFKNVYENVRFGRIVHLTSHAEFITKKKAKDNVPIYEGKFFNQFDGKFSGFNGVEDELRYGNKSSSVNIDESKKMITDYFPESRFFINAEKWQQLSKNHNEKFMLVWRSLTSATNTRTCIATVLPFIPASQSVQFLTTNQNDLLYLSGLFNSVVFDFILKKKLSGIDLTQSVINQMPVPNIEQAESKIEFKGVEATIKHHISLLVFSLLKNDVRLNTLFENLELQIEIRTESKFETVRKIDLLFMALYKLTDSEVELVLTEFSKQYSKEDLNWFKIELEAIQLNEPIGPASSHISHLSPN
ncbi:Eco57I restriction-modification methylase domain-containing protein [Marivirga sp.]|uniref:Eco57I restriction-modification methylase domain-containing protein n=1 Tax=Marivirga sp. TaxID=2018662 RepID=UPI003DA79145